jgi:hypothetical protein
VSKKKPDEKGMTRAQLEAKVKRLEAKVKRLELRLAAAQADLALLRAPDRARREGEHWYELVDLLDPAQIRTLPKSPLGRTFLMGTLRDWIVLEYPAEAARHEVDEFMKTLRERGVGPVLAVRAGVRFLRLATVDPAAEAKLDEEVRDGRAATEGQHAGTPGDAGARSQLHGDGLGSGGPPSGDDHRGGRDHDGEGEGD